MCISVYCLEICHWPIWILNPGNYVTQVTSVCLKRIVGMYVNGYCCEIVSFRSRVYGSCCPILLNRLLFLVHCLLSKVNDLDSDLISN